MLKLNLFYEQQQIQREKDLDPIRLTIVAGVLIILGICAWAFFIYYRLGPLRAEVAANQARSVQKKKELAELGTPIDLPKVQSQSDALHEYQVNRILAAPLLEALRESSLTNCQIRIFNIVRDFKEVTIVEKDAKNKERDVKKTAMNVDVFLEADAEALDKVQLLQIRDQLIHSFRHEALFRPWVKQVPESDESTNMVNSVISVSSVTKDPKFGESQFYRGFFEIKLPMAVKDAPRSLP